MPSRDQLATYRRKRDFARTPEPSGSPKPAASPAQGAPPPVGGARFVVQRHRARALHYDLRFEIDGVLVSWAVPKGPTLDSAVRRAAFHVEDHPIEYLDFEGVIPAGEYGGGDVIVWDIGTWQPGKAGDPRGAVSSGELHADVYGQKLRGRFVLVRTRVDASGKEEWLLLHKQDEYAVSGWDAEDYPHSVLSGRTNDEVKAHPERVWRSDLPAAQASQSVASPSKLDSAGEQAVAELEALGASGTWQVYGRELEVTDLDRVLLPARPGEKPVTKRDLLRYAATIAPVALPYLTRRPEALHRFPSGWPGRGSWQRAVPKRAPEWLGRWEDGGRTSLVIDEPAALVWAVANGALQWRAAAAQVDHPDQPTYAMVELDGTPKQWPHVLATAQVFRTALEHLGLVGRAMLTGEHGLQIWVPTTPGPSAEETRAWAQELCDTVTEVLPKEASQVRLDVGANTLDGALSPYSPFPGAGAPVSAPIDWEELDGGWLRPEGFTIRTVLDRVARSGDPFSAVAHGHQTLPRLH